MDNPEGAHAPYAGLYRVELASCNTAIMIVSASYRTDIPAFYATWFENRFRAGFARVANPHGGADSVVPLRRGVDGFVFWTRNVAPFRHALREVRQAGLPFVVSHTVLGYPRALDRSVVEPGRAIDQMREVAAEFGPRAVVWRYDPIVASSLTPARWHRDNFARLAGQLAGTVDECVISFATLYKKTARNLDAAARADGFSWGDFADGEKPALAAELAGLAADAGMRLRVCSQDVGQPLAACVDARRLADVADGWGLLRAIAAKVKGNRPDCRCHQSRDIGAYDTCPHGCAYCYAVGSRALAKRRHAGHDPAGDYLFPPVSPPPTRTLL